MAKCILVPGEGGISNQIEGELEQKKVNVDAFRREFEKALTPEVCEELFETLAYWNEYLEKDVPYFQNERGPEL